MIYNLYIFISFFVSVFASYVCNTSSSIVTQTFHQKTLVTPQMYGAMGDGCHDDTDAIRKACLIGADTLFFPTGTYNINIPKGNRDKSNIFFHTKSNVIIGEEGSVIKLGKGNGNAADGYGFESIFSFNGTNRQIEFKNLIFDFNYQNNPIYQYTSNDVGVEMNGQQMAINAYRVSGLKVDNCIFIDHSGTNCIVYRGNCESNELFCSVTNCKFLKVGNKSIYKGKQAFHDCSTIGMHSDRKRQRVKLKVNVENNVFEGVGGNAFNVCECAADTFLFRNNVVIGYEIGVMPLTTNPETIVSITENIFKRVARGVGFWSCSMDIDDKTDYIGFKKLTISDNYIHIDIPYFLKRPNFRTINNLNDGYYLGGLYSAVCSMGNWNKSVGVINIQDNFIYYEDCKYIDNKYITKYNKYNGSVVGLYNAYNTEPSNALCHKFEFQRNTTINAPTSIIRLVPFNRIDSLVVNDNILTSCWINAPLQIMNEGLISIHPSVYKNMETISWGPFWICGNVLDYYIKPISETLDLFYPKIVKNRNQRGVLYIENNNVESKQ